jgi:hypothetical protein
MDWHGIGMGQGYQDLFAAAGITAREMHRPARRMLT